MQKCTLVGLKAYGRSAIINGTDDTKHPNPVRALHARSNKGCTWRGVTANCYRFFIGSDQRQGEIQLLSDTTIEIEQAANAIRQ